MKAGHRFRAAFVAAALAAAPLGSVWPASAGDKPQRDWIFSGAELIEALEGRPRDEAPHNAHGRELASARANAYIAGVADATSGTAWCGAGTVLPHELADRVYSYHRTVEPGLLLGNASALVIQALTAAFPCAAG